MSLFNTTASLRHTSVLPAGTDKAQAVKLLLQDHPFFVKCGPHSVDCVRVDADEEARLGALALSEDESGEHPLPATVSSTIAAALSGRDSSSGGRFEVYRVTDVVHTLPAGLWDSRVVSTYEMTDTPAGVYVRIRSPMSIVMDSVWTVAERQRDSEDGSQRDTDDDSQDDSQDDSRDGSHGKDEGELELIEEMLIYCSRLLVGTVKGLCDSGWEQIHAKMAARLQQDRAAQQGDRR